MKTALASTLCLLLFASCITTERDNSGLGAAKRSLATSVDGWTTEFMRRRLVVANDVRITGPQGLRNHLATRFDPNQTRRHEETTPEGYLQVYTQKPGATQQLATYLDKLEIHSTGRLTVLEQPGEVNVVVVASGDVYFVDLDSHDEQRVPTLKLTGIIPR